MSKEVQVTGMEVKTTVGSNLLISTTNLDADYTSQTLSQTRKALLEPTSTINGVTGTYYYTVNAKANGDAVLDVYDQYAESATTAVQNATAGKANYDSAFNNAYKLGASGVFTSDNIAMTDQANGAAYGYIDYTFYLKATSNGTAGTQAPQDLRMTKCDLDYNDGALDADGTVGKVDGPDRAWRVAIFASDITSTAAGTGRVDTDVAGTVANQKGLLSISGAAYQTVTDSKNQAVTSGTALGDVLNNGTSGVIIDSITANASKYYKVTVRLWLEGEDTTCTSETYAALTNKYNLDLAFELTDGNNDTAAVTAITSNGWDPTTTPNNKVFTGNQYDGEAQQGGVGN